MSDARRPITLLATVALVLAACGGGGGSATAAAPGGGAATSSPTQATTSEATTAPTSGGTAAGVCGLVTADELAEVFGVPSVTTTVFVGPPDTCSVESDAGDALAAWSYSTANAGSTYDMFVLPAQSVDVPGIGDKAAFVDNTGLLVLKGDALVVIGVMTGVGDVTQDEMNELMKQIGALAAGRM
jgi:hypothetical protein